MNIDVLTLFPEMFTGVFQSSMMKRAQEKGSVRLNTVNFRDYAQNKHGTVDDMPYGGGAGMVLKPEPIFRALEALDSPSQQTLLDEKKQVDLASKRVILMCPQGKPFSQNMAEELACEQHLIFICGHYEGYDERIREQLVTDEISIGDYVLTGGEVPAMVVIDSVVRLLPGVLGNSASARSDSFSTGRLEYPQYTRPADYKGLKVPEVLLSGHHQNIANWRKQKSLKRTWERRPDLLVDAQLDEEEKSWIRQFENER